MDLDKEVALRVAAVVTDGGTYYKHKTLITEGEVEAMGRDKIRFVAYHLARNFQAIQKMRKRDLSDR